MKYGIEFEFFVAKEGKIVPAHLATNNLDGNPLLGEVKTAPHDTLLDCVFELDKLIYKEKQALSQKGYSMSVISEHTFSDDDLRNLRRSANYDLKKEVLEEFSIYPNNKLGKLLKRGLVKASLQINFSKNQNLYYTEHQKIKVEDKVGYEPQNKTKIYSTVFNYVDILFKLDHFYRTDIKDTNRVPGVYAIKSGNFGNRIEYRSLPNTVDYKLLIKLLEE